MSYSDAVSIQIQSLDEVKQELYQKYQTKPTDLYRENYQIAQKMDRKTSLKKVDRILNSDVKSRKAHLDSFVLNGDLHKKFLHNPRAVQNSH